MKELYFISVKRKNKLKDQNNSKGVSVDITKLPNEAAGVNIHIKAAAFPILDPNAICPHNNKIIEVIKWMIGADNLTAHSSFPNMFVEIAITQAIRGGFVK